MNLTLTARRFLSEPLPLGTAWLLADCMESKGKQDLWARRKPEVLAALRERAMVQSVESSNRMEGVTVPSGRLRPVVLRRSRPRDRPEEELAGYRRALDWVHSRPGRLPVTPGVIRRLHAQAQSGSGDAGEWKKQNNEIIEILPSGHRRVRFVPAPAKATPGYVGALCLAYEEALVARKMPPLLLAATFVFDFLCIHPFRDGNGRVSRLLTTLLFQVQGFEVGRYISLERLVEERKEDYYRVLEECSAGWQTGRNEIVPWWNFLLSIVRAAYRDFEIRVEKASPRPAKTEMVRGIILEQEGNFTLAELAAQIPSASPQLIKKVLAELKLAGQARLNGRGRGALWTLAGQPL
jgi:Fic family protein